MLSLLILSQVLRISSILYYLPCDSLSSLHMLVIFNLEFLSLKICHRHVPVRIERNTYQTKTTHRVNVETGVMPCCNRCSPDFVYDKIVSSADFYQHCDIVLSSILLFILNLFWSWINICFIYCFKKNVFLRLHIS